MNRLKSIIFDMDGTLLDSMGMWQRLDRIFLRENGIEPPADISEIVKKTTVDASSAYFVERFSLPMTPQQVRERVEQLAAEDYLLHLPLKPGAVGFLEAVRERGIPCVLASANYPSLLEAAMKRLGIDGYFRAVLTPDASRAGKHEPDIYLEAAQILGTEPAETAVPQSATAALTAGRSSPHRIFCNYSDNKRLRRTILCGLFRIKSESCTGFCIWILIWSYLC